MPVDHAPDDLPVRLPTGRILVGIAGSIGALWMPQSIMWLRDVAGVEVRVIVTRPAATMVTPRAIAVASGNLVALDADDTPNDPTVPHIELTRWADVMLVMPATANVLAKAASGIADDLLTTCIVAAACPVVLVPSMNGVMWNKPAVQRNVATLRADGYGVISPIEGIAVSDGQPTVGAMPEIDVVFEWLTRFVAEAAEQEPQVVAHPAANGIVREVRAG